MIRFNIISPYSPHAHQVASAQKYFPAKILHSFLIASTNVTSILLYLHWRLHSENVQYRRAEGNRQSAPCAHRVWSRCVVYVPHQRQQMPCCKQNVHPVRPPKGAKRTCGCSATSNAPPQSLKTATKHHFLKTLSNSLYCLKHVCISRSAAAPGGLHAHVCVTKHENVRYEKRRSHVQEDNAHRSAARMV